MEELKVLGETCSEFFREYAGKFRKISKKCPHRELHHHEWDKASNWVCGRDTEGISLARGQYYCRYYNCPYLPNRRN